MPDTKWIRMALAFSAVLLIGGTGLVLAAGPNPNGHPVSSVLLGPGLVGHNGTAQYTLRVLFNYGNLVDFPPTMGATFTASQGTINQSGFYTAPATGSRERVTGSFRQNGVKVSSSLIITLQ